MMKTEFKNPCGLPSTNVYQIMLIRLFQKDKLVIFHDGEVSDGNKCRRQECVCCLMDGKLLLRKSMPYLTTEFRS